jgi:membrane protease YdiL (CAAX protease family)
MVFATLMVLVVAITPIVVDGSWRVIAAWRGLKPGPPADFSAFTPYSAIVLQAVLLWGAVRGARVAANGDLARGLAYRPVRRRGLIALFAVLVLTWDAAAVSALGWFVSRGGQAPKLPSAISTMPPGFALAAIHIVFLAVLAPVVEELFFRGWLWSALRKTWSPGLTMTWTTGLWLGMHFMDGSLRPLILLPTGILLALARQYGDSVRASMVLHLMNNGMVVAVQLAALLLAGSA